MVGSRIKHYQLSSLLGDGGMGAVYLAQDLNLGRPVAVKVLLPELMRNPDLQARLAQEARIQGRLNHPSIVGVYDFDVDSGAIVMEYVEGRPLDQVIVDRGGPLDLPSVRSIFSQILQGVAYAHDFRDGDITDGIVHRDLKPANVLIRQTPTGLLAKITDFGVARILGETRRLTAAGTRMGTLWYMSPEQVRSPRDVDHRSDIYALGVVLFEMLTGTVPFDGDSDFDVMNRIVQEAPPDLSTLGVALPQSLENILKRALEKEPDDRFQTCGDMLGAFEAAFVTEPVDVSRSYAPVPVSAGAQSPMDSMRKFWAGFSKNVQMGVIGGGILLLGMMVWGLTGSSKSSAGFEEPDSPAGVVRAWVKANTERDTITMMHYYAPTVQWYGSRIRNGRLYEKKAGVHHRFDLRSAESVDDLDVQYSQDRRRAVVEYDTLYDFDGLEEARFTFEARRRVRLKDIRGHWRIDCEEEAEVYVAPEQNPHAEGTILCLDWDTF